MKVNGYVFAQGCSALGPVYCILETESEKPRVHIIRVLMKGVTTDVVKMFASVEFSKSTHDSMFSRPVFGQRALYVFLYLFCIHLNF